MYPDKYAVKHPDRAAFIMASTGEAVSYSEFEGRSNSLAQLLRAAGLGIEDHYSVFMENNARYLEACAAGERAGLYYTCINSFLTAEEVAYIIQNSESLSSDMKERLYNGTALEWLDLDKKLFI